MATGSAHRGRDAASRLDAVGARRADRGDADAFPAKRKLALPRDRPLRDGILAAFSRILAVSRRVAREARADPVRAVHEYRKSIRRARALISLLGPALGKRAAGGFTRHLRQAFRETGALRDADILLATLRSLPAEASDLPARAAAEEILARRQREVPGPAETQDILRRSAGILRPLPGALAVVLPEAFSTNDLERGLARSECRVRRSLRRAVASRADVDFHEWRKRVKELRYQVELLAAGASVELKTREKALGKLAEELGKVTDALVLLRELERLEEDGAIPPGAAWLDRIRLLIREQSDTLLSGGTELFADAPRRFARRVLAERG